MIPTVARALAQMTAHAVPSATSLFTGVDPRFIDSLDNGIRDDLQSCSHWFFLWVLISAFLVAVGVALEGPEILHEIWPKLFTCSGRGSVPRIRKFKKAIKIAGLCGWLLVVVGIVGEGIFEGLQNRAEGQLQTFNDILLTDAERNAGSARASAIDAANAASLADSESEKAIASSGNAIVLAQGARKEANSFERDIFSAKKQATKAENDLAVATERTARLEQQLSWRTVTPEQRSRLKTLLLSSNLFMPLSNLKIDISYLNQDPEAEEYAHELKDALDGFGAEISEPNGAEFMGPRTLQGVIMAANPVRNRKATLLLNAINRAGIAVSGVPNDNMDEHSISITVGTKPRGSVASAAKE